MSVVESLPRPAENRVTHSASADKELHEINPAYLRLDAHERVGLRGMIFSVSVLSVLVSATVFWSNPDSWDLLFGNLREVSRIEMVGLWSVALGVPGIPFLMAYFSARAKLDPPYIISRRTRRIYAWLRSEKKWIEMEYDRIVAIVFRQRIVNAGGSMTVYRLQLQQRLRPDSPQFDYALSLGNPFTSPEGCGQLWEFIRRYMDGPPEALPPVQLLPPLGTAWMADADLGMPCVDDNHRVKYGIFGYLVVLVVGSLEYWMARSTAWIARTAPRPPFSARMKAAMQWTGPNPYRIKQPSEDGLLALQGKLLRMRLRWHVCGLISTGLQVWFLSLVLQMALRP